MKEKRGEKKKTSLSWLEEGESRASKTKTLAGNGKKNDDKKVAERYW